MANLIEYATLLQRGLDKQVEQQATSGWMEGNAGQVQYTGGKEVKVPMMSLTGLGDYDRAGGKYPRGSINLEYQTMTLTQDRGNEFYFDRHDVDESNYIVNATNVLGEFQRLHVIPEIDAYRYSAIASALIAAGKSKETTLTASTVLEQFIDDVRGMQDKTGLDTGSLIATVPYPVYALFEKSDKLSKILIPQQFEQGGLKFEVMSIDGIPIRPVVSNRMKTAYIFHDGDGEFGFEPDVDAKTINWIISPRTAPIGISKTDKVKIFDPDTNQDGDGWKTQYRKYHDLWLKQNQLDTIIVSVEG